jgi:hypothetical protein
MNADDHLIEHLRASMNVATTDVFPPRDLLRGIPPVRERRRWRPSGGGLVVAVATVSTIAVVLVAIMSLGHPRTAPPPVAPLTRPATNATSLPSLRSELAILRRPQRARDKLPGWGIAAEQRQNCSNCLNVAKLVHGETRLLARIHIPGSARADGRGPERIYLVLGTVPSSWGNGRISGWRQHGHDISGLHLSLVGLTTRRSPMAQPLDELINPLQMPMPAQTLTPRAVIITSLASVGVVPDGVTRVRWELANPGQAKPIAVYPRVRGNVAVAPWTPAPRSTSLINEQLLVGATWYGADGHVIATFSDSMAKAFSP